MNAQNSLRWCVVRRSDPPRCVPAHVVGVAKGPMEHTFFSQDLNDAELFESPYDAARQAKSLWSNPETCAVYAIVGVLCNEQTRSLVIQSHEWRVLLSDDARQKLIESGRGWVVRYRSPQGSGAWAYLNHASMLRPSALDMGARFFGSQLDAFDHVVERLEAVEVEVLPVRFVGFTVEPDGWVA